MHIAPVRVHSPGTAAVCQKPATTWGNDCFPRIHRRYDYYVLLTKRKPKPSRSRPAPGTAYKRPGNAGKALSEPGTNASRIPRPGEPQNITADTGRRQP